MSFQILISFAASYGQLLRKVVDLEPRCFSMYWVFILHSEFRFPSDFLLLCLSSDLLKDVRQLELLVDCFGYCSLNELFHCCLSMFLRLF